MEGSSVQNYKKTNPPAPTTGVGRTSSNKPWMGYTPRVPEAIKEWLHSTHFPFSLYPLAGKGPLCPPEVFLHFQLSSFSIWREGTHTKRRRQTDRWGWGCFPHSNHKAKGLARTLGPGRVGTMYKWQMQAPSSHVCEPDFPEPISYILLSIIRWSMCQSVLHQKITRPSDLVK